MTRICLNPPQHIPGGHLLEGHVGFTAAPITRKGAEPWGPKVTSRGPWDLNPTLLKHEGFCVLRPSLFLWILFHLDWVFKPLAFALKVSLLWRLVEISITLVFIVKEWVGTKNISILDFFFFKFWSPAPKFIQSSEGGDLAPWPLAHDFPTPWHTASGLAPGSWMLLQGSPAQAPSSLQGHLSKHVKWNFLNTLQI